MKFTQLFKILLSTVLVLSNVYAYNPKPMPGQYSEAPASEYIPDGHINCTDQRAVDTFRKARKMMYMNSVGMEMDESYNGGLAAASYQTNTVYVGTLVLGFTDAQLLFVFGHELTHIKEMHARSTYDHEIVADAGGAKLVHEAGYSLKEVVGLLESPMFSDGGGDHPDGKDRAEAVRAIMKHNGWS